MVLTRSRVRSLYQYTRDDRNSLRVKFRLFWRNLGSGPGSGKFGLARWGLARCGLARELTIRFWIRARLRGLARELTLAQILADLGDS